MQKLLALTIPGSNGKGQEILAPSGIPTGGLSSDGGRIIAFGITIFLFICILLAFAFIVWGGVSWILSEGDKTKLDNARRTIIYAVIGLIIAFLSLFIINMVGSALGVDFLKASL